MSVFRPSNINKRLVGTPSTVTGGSPGNAGQIGPTKTPYGCKTRSGISTATASLGATGFGPGECAGVFRSKESFCGTTVGCKNPFITSFGGNLICRASSVAWIVAPSSTEVSRNWYSRNDANTRAQEVSGCAGWFVPNCGQLQNPGSTCRTYWGSYCPTVYWSSSEIDPGKANCVNIDTGFAGGYIDCRYSKPTVRCVRAFRCVTY
jgi:hypothetical protein